MEFRTFRLVSFPMRLALLMAIFAVGFVCFGFTSGPEGGLLVRQNPAFETFPMLFSGLFGLAWGYWFGRIMANAIRRWPKLFTIDIPPDKLKRTAVAYAVVPLAILAWHLWNMNLFGLLCATTMLGSGGMVVLEAKRLQNLCERPSQ